MCAVKWTRRIPAMEAFPDFFIILGGTEQQTEWIHCPSVHSAGHKQCAAAVCKTAGSAEGPNSFLSHQNESDYGHY